MRPAGLLRLAGSQSRGSLSAELTSLPAGQGRNLTGLTWMESDKCNPTIRPLAFLITIAAVCITESIATSEKEL